MSQGKTNYFIIITLPLILLSFFLGSWVNQENILTRILNGNQEINENINVIKAQEIDFSLLLEAWESIENYFVGIEKVDKREVVEGAISGMIESLKDPYTVFLDIEETKRFQQELKGEFGGIGARIGFREEQLIIVEPLPGTPAANIGLQPGDKIIEIDQTNSQGLTLSEAVNLIRGPKGTDVVLLILRENWNYPREIKIRRDMIKVPTVSWELKDEKIAHITIYHFSLKVNRDLNAIINEINLSEADRIILDLRNNPGGDLRSVIQTTSLFLKEGDSILIEKTRDQVEKTHRVFRDGRLSKLPMVILINQQSASGAEILAGALRDNRNIPLVGETTFGKGSVQKIVTLSDGSSLKITIAEWLTPLRHRISAEGIQPDYLIEKTIIQIQEGEDPQLDKAMMLIKKK